MLTCEASTGSWNWLGLCPRQPHFFPFHLCLALLTYPGVLAQSFHGHPIQYQVLTQLPGTWSWHILPTQGKLLTKSLPFSLVHSLSRSVVDGLECSLKDCCMLMAS